LTAAYRIAVPTQFQALSASNCCRPPLFTVNARTTRKTLVLRASSDPPVLDGGVVPAQASGEGLKTQIDLLWELEDTIAQTKYMEAAKLQEELRRIRGLDSEDLLPVGKNAFKGWTVLVAGGNGRVGSAVVKELLRRGCNVKATVRNSDDVMSFERLSYEIGAEEGIGDIQAPWVRKSVEMTATPEMEAYGLARLQVVECDVLDAEAVAKAVRGVDAVVYCATDFAAGRPKWEAPEVFTPDALFSVVDKWFLRDARERGRQRDMSRERRADGYADLEGATIVADALAKEKRLASLAGVNSVPPSKKVRPLDKLASFVLLSASAEALPLDKFPPGTVANLKRQAESEVLAKRLPATSVLRLFKLKDSGREERRPVVTVAEDQEPQTLGEARGLQDDSGPVSASAASGAEVDVMSCREAARVAVLALAAGEGGIVEVAAAPRPQPPPSKAKPA